MRVTLTDAIPASVETRFYPSGCGGHKNSENAATFSEFLGGRKNLGSTREQEEKLLPRAHNRRKNLESAGRVIWRGIAGRQLVLGGDGQRTRRELWHYAECGVPGTTLQQ